MKKFLSSLLIALTVLITTSPVCADGESISSVTVVGATEQSGTPTPSNPVNIVTNNGVLKVVINIHNVSTDTLGGYLNPASDELVSVANYGHTNYIPVVTGQTYQIGRRGVNTTDANAILQYNENKVFQTSQAIDALGGTYTVPNGVSYIRCNFNKTYQQFTLKRNSTFYTEGMAETITDSANHSANVETLFAVGDYADEQNINTGVITRKVGVKVFNGTENWSLWRNGYTTMVLRGIARARTVPLSNITESVSSKIELDGSADLNFYNIVTDFPTVTDWKRYIADQYAAGTPVIVIYPLAEPTTESVAGQTMTTAPVIQNNGTIATTIRTLLQNGQTLVSNSLELGIKIATTAYNTARFNPVINDLNSTVATIRDIVTNTINQTAAIASLQADKQTRPEDACPAGKKCLLVETEENGVIVPHWYPIIENIYGLPTGYTALEYIESTGGGAYIRLNGYATNDTSFDMIVTRNCTERGKGLYGAASSGSWSLGSGIETGANQEVYLLSGGEQPMGKFITIGTEVHIVQNKNVYTATDVNGTRTRTQPGGEFQTSYPVMVGAITAHGSTRPCDSVWKYFNVSGMVDSDGNVLPDVKLIPAQNASGVVGMYDTVSGQFFTNAGTGTFTAGPEM